MFLSFFASLSSYLCYLSFFPSLHSSSLPSFLPSSLLPSLPFLLLVLATLFSFLSSFLPYCFPLILSVVISSPLIALIQSCQPVVLCNRVIQFCDPVQPNRRLQSPLSVLSLFLSPRMRLPNVSFKNVSSKLVVQSCHSVVSSKCVPQTFFNRVLVNVSFIHVLQTRPSFVSLNRVIPMCPPNLPPQISSSNRVLRSRGIVGRRAGGRGESLSFTTGLEEEEQEEETEGEEEEEEEEKRRRRRGD